MVLLVSLVFLNGTLKGSFDSGLYLDLSSRTFVELENVVLLVGCLELEWRVLFVVLLILLMFSMGFFVKMSQCFGSGLNLKGTIASFFGARTRPET